MTFPADDEQFTEHIITSVVPYDDGFEVEAKETADYDGDETQDKGLLFLPKVEGAIPETGAKLRVYGVDSQVRGAFVNGAEVFYRTEEEDREHGKAIAEKEKAERAAAYEAEKVENDARIGKLPGPFQDRILAFRERNSDFGPEYEGYELFACEQAMVIVNALKTTEAIQEWVNLKVEEQYEKVPDLSKDHSGNTFGFAARLAFMFANDQPDFIRKFHGALCPLVGCDSYGCWAASEEATAEKDS